VAEQVGEKLDDLRAPDRTGKQTEVKVPPGHAPIADKVFQLKWYCGTGVFPFGAQVRQRYGRSLSPLSSMKTMVRPSVSLLAGTNENASALPEPPPEPCSVDLSTCHMP